MTAIAYKDGILATDRQVSWDSVTTIGKKIHFVRVANLGPCIVSLSGYVWGEEVLLKQLEQFSHGTGQDTGDMVKQARYGFLITKQLHVHGIYGDGRVGLREHHENDYFAEGSAFKFLMGAMAHGASAEEAVKLACEHCDGCGRGIEVLNVKDYLDGVYV